MDIGIATLESSEEIEEIYISILPSKSITKLMCDAIIHTLKLVICDPPCDFGACVANDTCICSEGYNGSTCSEIGKYRLVFLCLV